MDIIRGLDASKGQEHGNFGRAFRRLHDANAANYNIGLLSNAKSKSHLYFTFSMTLSNSEEK